MRWELNHVEDITILNVYMLGDSAWKWIKQKLTKPKKDKDTI